jgi:hypothetical protein
MCVNLNLSIRMEIYHSGAQAEIAADVRKALQHNTSDASNRIAQSREQSHARTTLARRSASVLAPPPKTYGGNSGDETDPPQSAPPLFNPPSEGDNAGAE